MKDTKETYKIRENCYSNFSFWFDRITGIFIKSKRHKIKNIKKILILRNDHIGDMAYCTQIFGELKKKFPKVKISVVATRGNRKLIEKDKSVDEIIECDLFWRRGLKGFLDYWNVLKKIKKQRFDVGIDLRKSKLNILFFLWLSGIKSRISFYNVNGGKAFLTHPILYDKKINYNLEPIKMINRGLGINIKNSIPNIVTDKADERKVKEMLKRERIKNYVVFAPGATVESKKWPAEKFNELIEKFHEKYPHYKIILSGAEGDRDLIETLCNKRNFCVPLIEFSADLRLMSIVFKNAAAVVANDGAGVAISCIANSNLIALMGPVDLKLHRPINKSKVLHHQVPCYPCDWAKNCEKPCGVWCMELITVEEVMEAIKGFIANIPIKSQ